MFDVGFSELMLIGVVALLVLGPERLPKAARTAGLWMGRARRFLATVKADIDKEIKAEELKQIIQKQAESSGLHEIVEQTRTAVDELKSGTAEVASATSSIAEPAITGPSEQPATPAAPPPELKSNDQ